MNFTIWLFVWLYVQHNEWTAVIYNRKINAQSCNFSLKMRRSRSLTRRSNRLFLAESRPSIFFQIKIFLKIEAAGSRWVPGVRWGLGVRGGRRDLWPRLEFKFKILIPFLSVKSPSQKCSPGQKKICKVHAMTTIGLSNTKIFFTTNILLQISWSGPGPINILQHKFYAFGLNTQIYQPIRVLKN